MIARSDQFVLAIDQGTTGTTVLLVDRAGAVVGRAYAEHSQGYPRPGWVEHDPDEIWTVTAGLIRRVLDEAGRGPASVAAVGITNQRETTVLWDRATGRPLHPAIVWQCRRTAPLCEELRRGGHAPLIRERTGLVPDPYFSGTKLAWLLEELPGARRRAEAGELAFGTIDSWLLWNLSDRELHVTEPTNASRTLLYDIHRRRWDPELLDLLGIPPAVLPEVRGSMERFGATGPESPLGPGIPLAGAAGDQQAALFGQGCWESGMAKNTYGTGCFLMMCTGDRGVDSTSGLLTTLAVGSGGEPCYALEGSVFIGGAVLQWLRDGLGLIGSAPEADRIAEEVADTGGVYLVPAFAGLGAPYWDMHARGAVLGITGGTTREHLVRAALESIAFQCCDVIRAMEADAGMPIRELRVDGGASRSDVLMQLQADLADRPVDRPDRIESTAAGAAYLAGLATGFYRDAAELARLRRRQRQFVPEMGASERERRYNGWTQAIHRVMTREAGRNG